MSDAYAMAISTPAVQVDSLRLKSGRFALEIENWSLQAGERAAFIGKNGSGKTTVLECLLGLRRHAELRGSLLGFSVAEWARRADLRQRLGVQLQRATLPFGLYVREIIDLHRNLYRRCSADVLEALEVPALSNRVYEQLSRGEQQRVELFLALAHEPDLIMLDEPLTGLDPRVAQMTANILRSFSRSAVLMACHSEIELSLVDTLVWMEDGVIREAGEPNAVRKRLLGEYRLQVSFHDEAQAAAFVKTVSERAQAQFIRFNSPTEVLVAGPEAMVRSAPSLAAGNHIAALQFGPTTLADLLYRCAHADLLQDARVAPVGGPRLAGPPAGVRNGPSRTARPSTECMESPHA